MKSIRLLTSLLVLMMLAACGAQQESDEKVDRGYLDSAYVSGTYRKAMDSLQANEALPQKDLKTLQRFMRDHRDSIFGHPTYGEILANAKSYKEMLSSGIGLTVQSMSVRKVQKANEVRFVLGFENLLGQPIQRFSGDVLWKNEEGEPLCKSPAFTIVGPLEQGGKVQDLKLEYAYDRPMGNEMNDPRKAAFRDTLVMMEKLAKLKNLSLFEFRLSDAVLGNGLSLEQYYMRSPKDQQALPQQEKPKKVMQVVDWAKKNEQWINWLRRTDAKYKLSVMPVLTEKSEYGHGPFLIFDRCAKVKAFFNVQKIIPGSHLKIMIPRMRGRRLVLNERVEFWNWPMEIRIFERL